MACRFPNPIPSGTRVPQWALIDITVRCYAFLNGTVFTASSSLRTIGTQTSLMQLVVRILSPSFSHYQCLTPMSYFLDSPEQVPGTLLGPSGAAVSASGTRSSATPSRSGESSSTVKPTPSPTPKSSSNTGAIVGGVVGGVAVIGLAAIAIGLFLRRRRPQAPSVTQPVVDVYQPPMDEIQQPLTMDDGYTASSIPGTIGSSSMPGTPGTPVVPMRIYVRVSCPICALLCSLIACAFFAVLSFYTQDPNDPSTFPGYQGVLQTPTTPQGAMPSANGTGNTLSTMQTSRGYHGLPTV